MPIDNGPIVGPVDTKKPWESKTVIINFCLAILGAVSLFWPGALGISSWINANGAVITVIWGGLNILLRLITKNAISLGD